MKKNIGFMLIAGGVLLFLAVLYTNSRFNNTTRPFSTYTLLTASWNAYKSKYINQDGRVIDFSQNDITTSEGQSYALLRSVFNDDRPAFDLVYKWTKENLKRPEDNLFSWRWGKKQDGTYGNIEGGGENSAADADVDIALALILASRRWNEPDYEKEALFILESIWNVETDVAASKRYLTAGNWAKNDSEIIINPSYFAPYAFREFAKVDWARDWLSLVGPGYEMLESASKSPLDKGASSGLPPNWIRLEKSNGNITAASLPNLTTDYSFDAIRVPFRIALDYQWNRDERAGKYLTTSFKFLHDEYKKNNRLATSYSHDGAVLIDTESPSMYATVLGAFIVSDIDLARNMYQQKILNLYSNDQNTFRDEIPYYEQNWLWFGAALMNNYLINYE